MKKQINYRLGIDMGATSLGWCMLRLNKENEPCGIIKMGVRIFPDGRDSKKKEPLNVARRSARSIRRNRERYKRRRSGLFNILVKNGLMPENKEKQQKMKLLDPYMLRAKGLDNKLELFEIGRAVFHLNQRRGFKSNLIIDKGSTESSAMKKSIKELRTSIEENSFRTLGEYLWNLNCGLREQDQNKRKAVRIKVSGTDKNREYTLFHDREMIENELKMIWEKQKEFYPEVLTADLYEEISSLIIKQRPLKPQEKGKCFFEYEEDRLLKSSPKFQLFRLLQTVNQLELRSDYGEIEEISPEQRDIILSCLKLKQKVTFKSIKKKLGKRYSEGYQFNLEDEKRSYLYGDETAGIMANKKNFGSHWHNLTIDEQSHIIKMLNCELSEFQHPEQIKNQLQRKYMLTNEQSENCLRAALPAGTGRLSEKAIDKILPFLKQGMLYSDACIAAGYQHSGEKIKAHYRNGDLPYYGKILPAHVIKKSNSKNDIDENIYGKISNVTVHIALNQLRKLVNCMSRKYGAPQQIVLELARDLKLSKKQKQDLKKRQTKETKDNERIEMQLRQLGIQNNYQNRLKYKLWEELNTDPAKRCCIYSGETISLAKLFSNKVEIEHILPKSRTFDDRRINKTLSTSKANRDKKERSPYEAFGSSPAGYNWGAILMRAEALPKAKYQRFFKDAMSKWDDEKEVISRMLNDTRYMSKIAREYMCHVAGEDNVWVIPGGMTAILRRKWGFNKLLNKENKKNRADHRHHAVDALTIALTSRAMLQKISKNICLSKDRYIDEMPEPYPGFSINAVQEIVDNTLVSFKPDHILDSHRKPGQTTGKQLHEDTAMGFRGLENDKYILHVRKPVSDIKDLKKAQKIADPLIRAQVADVIANQGDVQEYFAQKGIERVRMIENKTPDTLIGIKDNSGKVFKYYVSGSNFCCDIFCPLNGKFAGKWKSEVISMYNAHQHDFIPTWRKEYPAAKKIMRLFINDIVVLKKDNIWQVRRVRKMSGSRIWLRSIFQAVDTSDKGEVVSASSLQKYHAFKAGIDILGRINPQIPENENC